MSQGPAVLLAQPEERITRGLSSRLRWLAIGIFALSSALNLLDRQLLASVAPALKSEFHLSNLQYGEIVSFFSMVYAFMTPFAGLLIDRIGLAAGISMAVIVWSLASVATGVSQTFRGLLGCRVTLGLGESAGIPSSSKATAIYLERREFGLGTACHAVGISLGSIAAPLLVAAMAPRFGWRSVFLVTGVVGLLWVPFWLLVSRRIPAKADAATITSVPLASMLRDRRLWSLIAANALIMTVYSLWANWTTIYFVEGRHLSQLDANRYFAWIPPIFATLGGFFGGALAFRWIRVHKSAVAIRLRVCSLLAPILLVTAAIPFIPSTIGAAMAVSISFFGCMSILTNLHVIPIDLFGAERAAFSSAVLTCSYALMQTIISPAIGGMVDHFGFTAVCVAMSVLPLVGVLVLRASIKTDPQ